MIVRFCVKNFRSIADIDLDFSYGEKRAPNRYQDMVRQPFLEDKGGKTRVVPCMALFGANAAGKSNIIKAFQVLRRAVISKDASIAKLYDGNLILDCGDLTTFKLTFEDKGVLFEYGLAYGRRGVVEEWLNVDGNELYGVRDGQCRVDNLVSDGYSKERIADIVKVECKNADGTEMIRPLLNVLGHGYQGLNEKTARAYHYFDSLINVWGELRDQTIFPLAADVLSHAAGISLDEATKRIVSVVRKLDVDILDIKIAEPPSIDKSPPIGAYDFIAEREGEGHGIVIQSLHKNAKGEDVFFRFMKQESEGTKRLATIVGFMLAALEKGSFICVDEFDWALHPLVVQEMLSLFMRKETNPKNAQLVFTTHMTDLLENGILRLSEACFVQKNIHVGTKTKRLVEMKHEGDDIRNVTNFRKQYLDGWYNAIPHPAL